jgi:F0F1-type ATP synthase assembly protein I
MPADTYTCRLDFRSTPRADRWAIESFPASMGKSSSGDIGKYTSLALLLPISTLIGFAMGYGLDKLFHTGWLRIVFLVLGTVSGFISLLRELDKDK